MKTKVFKNWLEFNNRDDRDLNGVSSDFAADNPDHEKENETNKGCWNSARCSRCSRCSDCSDCSRCSRCSRCSDCKNIALLSNKKGFRPTGETASKSWFDVPKIANIHNALKRAVDKPGALEMRTWHTCETTHCRAGWIVTLAGEKGRALEAASSTLFAAMQIYKASSPIRVSPVRFFEKNEVAMADIERCAEEEAESAQ